MAGNRYLEEFVQDINRRYSRDTSDMSLGDWICANTTLAKAPFSFERYPFQKQIADDMHPNMDVIKPSQVGLTEIQIRKILGWLHRTRHVSAILTLPNEKMFKRISTPRILPIVNYDDVFNMGDLKPVRSQGMIQVGDSMLYVTGAAESDATSISADAVFNDEIDLTDPGMLSLFNSRLQNSDHKINQRFSTPTFEGFGVDLGYQASDQHEYLCKCHACNHWQAPTFTREYIDIKLPDNFTDLSELTVDHLDQYRIDLAKVRVVCARCRAPLDLGNYSAREWVPKYPSRDHARGYKVSPFSTHRLDPAYIIAQLFKYKERDYIRGWYNTVLGMPHTGGDARLSEAHIKFCMARGQGAAPPPNTVKPAWIGVDVGATCYIVVGEGNTTEDLQIVRMETCLSSKLKERIKELMDIYNVRQACGDRHPYTPTVNEIRDDIGSAKFMPVEYRGTKDINIVEEPTIEDSTIMKPSHIQADRTMFVDAGVGLVRRGVVVINDYRDKESVIIEHFRDMVRDEKPGEPAKWIKLTGNDHYLHAYCFMVYSIKVYGKLHSIPDSEPRTKVGVLGVAMQDVQQGLEGFNRVNHRVRRLN